jgi:hypothetical protein
MLNVSRNNSWKLMKRLVRSNFQRLCNASRYDLSNHLSNGIHNVLGNRNKLKGKIQNEKKNDIYQD